MIESRSVLLYIQSRLSGRKVSEIAKSLFQLFNCKPLRSELNKCNKVEITIRYHELVDIKSNKVQANRLKLNM